MLTQIKLMAVACEGGGDFFGLPHWYKYVCGREFKFPADIPLVALAIVEMMLRIAAIIAIGYAVYGGIKYELSQGDPGKVAEAKGTIINALVGMVIAALAVAIVSFLGNELG